MKERREKEEGENEKVEKEKLGVSGEEAARESGPSFRDLDLDRTSGSAA